MSFVCYLWEKVKTQMCTMASIRSNVPRKIIMRNIIHYSSTFKKKYQNTSVSLLNCISQSPTSRNFVVQVFVAILRHGNRVSDARRRAHARYNANRRSSKAWHADLRCAMTWTLGHYWRNEGFLVGLFLSLGPLKGVVHPPQRRKRGRKH